MTKREESLEKNIWINMKVLIIGGSGRISLSVTKTLYNIGFEVTVINRGNNNQLIKNLNTYISDIKDEKRINSFLKDKFYEVVIDFVSYDVEDIKRSYSYFKNHTNHYIFISSVVVYKHTKETDKLITEESIRDNPYSLYANNKILAENALIKIGQVDLDFHYTILRFGQTFDERNLPTLFHGKNGTYDIIYRIMNDKPLVMLKENVSWRVLFASDVCLAIIPLFNNPKSYGKIFNIVSKETYTWEEIYNFFGSILNKKINFVYVPCDVLCSENKEYLSLIKGDKANNANYDFSKIIKISPNFIHQTKLESALKKTIYNLVNNFEYHQIDIQFNEEQDSICKKYKNVYKSWHFYVLIEVRGLYYG